MPTRTRYAGYVVLVFRENISLCYGIKYKDNKIKQNS